MSEQLYQARWRIEGDTRVLHGPIVSKEQAQNTADKGNQMWEGLILFWIEPVPDYTPPAITAEMDLETRAGSPRGVENDLLGLP